MVGVSLYRMRMAACITLAAGIIGLLAIALSLPLAVMIGAFFIALVSAYFSMVQSRALAARYHQLHHTLAAFMRGEMDARILNIGTLDAWGKLQHRINNILDIVDHAARKEYAAVYTGEDDAYIQKITATGLSVALQMPTGEPVLEMPAQLNVAPLLKELAQLQQAIDQLQQLTRELSRRADRNTQPTGGMRNSGTLRRLREYAQHIPLVIKTLHETHEQLARASTSVDRIAERAEIVALNMAISAAHAGGDDRMHAAVASLRLLADQSRAAQASIATMVEQASSASAQAAHHLQQTAEMLDTFALSSLHESEVSNAAAAKPALVTQVASATHAANGLKLHADKLEAALHALEQAA